MKSASGVYVTVVLSLITAEPLAGSVTVMTESVSPSGSESLSSTAVVTAVSSGVVSVSSFATGASFTASKAL